MEIRTSMNGLMESVKTCLEEAKRNAEEEDVKTSKSCFNDKRQAELFKRYYAKNTEPILSIPVTARDRKFKLISWRGLLHPDNMNPGVMKIFIDYYLGTKGQDSPYGSKRSGLNPEFVLLMQEAVGKWPSLCRQICGDWAKRKLVCQFSRNERR